MTEAETSDPQRAGGEVVAVSFQRSTHSPPRTISFDRRELQAILNLYGRRVAEGEWRDYAIDFSPLRAVFSIFRRTSETPLYTIEKNPTLARKQGAYAVVTGDGRILKRGHELDRVLAILEKKLRLVT